MDKFLIKKAKVVEQRPPTQSVESDGSESDTAGEKKDPKRKFRKEWLTQFNWLKEQNGSAYCTACEKSMVNHVAKLKRHTEQSSHVQNVIKKKGQVKLDSFLKEQNDTLEKQIRNAEFSLVIRVLSGLKNSAVFTLRQNQIDPASRDFRERSNEENSIGSQNV
ncbi:uncharacterized protein LOC131800509 [Musca domestica]|uniref:Uncharacterized protein LOC131800509 n=1 Tax=Musca domestica TaxID=7370 RepID=A0ABM3UN98_MUSDO|nr:uncharacterized protein LOC131800509 [Musca domestica]